MCHSIISMSFCHLIVILSFECHSVIWMPFHSSKGHSCHLNLIPSFHCHPIIPSSFRPKNLIHLSFHHLNVIQPFDQPFECHLVIWMSFLHSNVILPFKCHSINHSSCWQYTIIRMSFHSSHVIYLILMPFYHSFVIPSFLTHFDLKTSFSCHPIIWMPFNHLSVILSLESHPSNHSSWWQNTVIWTSFHSFYSHSSIGMTENDILLGWQQWC